MSYTDTLNRLCAKDIMHGNLLTVYEGWTIHRLAEFFIRRQISAAPVIASDHELVGVVSVSDVCHFNAMDDEGRGDALRNLYRDSCGQEISENDLRAWVKAADRNCTVHQIMVPEVITVDHAAPLEQVVATLIKHHIHRVFVTESGKINGVITAMDALTALHTHLKKSPANEGPVPA
ncbi:CBS domain-containing protein [Marinimicrobium locisalis]|uniref:CBS domain-containing protein n=1 Tax=Marinimicrobium locisalis TaxID=546022 RepID=UPI003221EB33